MLLLDPLTAPAVPTPADAPAAANASGAAPPNTTSLPDLPAGARVLIVDDEPLNVALLEDLLGSVGHPPAVCATTDARRALGLFREFRPDLVLLDLMMPHLDGFGVLAQLGPEVPAGVYLPVLMLTADVTQRNRQRALAAGATDFLTKPFDSLEGILRIRNLLTARMQHLQLQRSRDGLEDLVAERTAELRATLDQLRESQDRIVGHERLSALGTMAAGVAHDFNNALTLIGGYGEMALAQLHGATDQGLTTQLLQAQLTAHANAVATVGRLRDFARPAEPDAPVESVDLNALAEAAAASTRPRWGTRLPSVDLRLNLQPGLPTFPGVTGDLRDALTNLIFNAVDALPAGGNITVHTRAPADGGDVLLEVSDDGTGMDEETRRRCLEPFFTTKGEKGTGMGLAMVYGAVQRHGGGVEIHTQPGRGTTFTLRLPRR